MSKAKLTEWFDGRKQKPWEPGVYQQKSGSLMMIGFQYWDGRVWYTWEETKEGAMRNYRHRAIAFSTYQNDPWRGLAPSSTERKRG